MFLTTYHLLVQKKNNDNNKIKKYITVKSIHLFFDSESKILKYTFQIKSHDTDFYSAVVSGKKMLIKSAVPTVFDFPNHLTPKIKERKILQREVSKLYN